MNDHALTVHCNAAANRRLDSRKELGMSDHALTILSMPGTAAIAVGALTK